MFKLEAVVLEKMVVSSVRYTLYISHQPQSSGVLKFNGLVTKQSICIDNCCWITHSLRYFYRQCRSFTSCVSASDQSCISFYQVEFLRAPKAYSTLYSVAFSPHPSPSMSKDNESRYGSAKHASGLLRVGYMGKLLGKK